MSRDVVATRRLRRSDSEQLVTIELYRPVRDADGEYSCAYQINGLGTEPVSGSARGVDALQAIVLAIKKIGSVVYTSELTTSGTLFWFEPGGGFGLLLPDTLRDLYRGDDPP